MKKLLLTAALAVIGTMGANAQLLFTQYYEGSAGTNKWLEIKNTGTSDIDLSTFSLSIYTNAAAENWKTGLTGSNTVAMGGTLTAGSVLIIGNSAATPTPSYLTIPANTFNSIANYNGNDSVVLWNNTSAFSTTQIVDAFSFTNLGNEGVDKSFVRLTTGTGYDLTSGTSILNHSSVWANTLLADVNGATTGTDNYLGFSSITAVPEPSTYALLGLGMIGLVALRRIKSSKI